MLKDYTGIAFLNSSAAHLHDSRSTRHTDATYESSSGACEQPVIVLKCIGDYQD